MKSYHLLFSLMFFMFASCSEEEVAPTTGQIIGAKIVETIGKKEISLVEIRNINDGWVDNFAGYSITTDGFIYAHGEEEKYYNLEKLVSYKVQEYERDVEGDGTILYLNKLVLVF